MAGRGTGSGRLTVGAVPEGTRVLVIEAPYYEDVANALLEGVQAELDAAGVSFERVSVPGALEIPQALRQAVAAGLVPRARSQAAQAGGVAVDGFDGVIVVGCVIRGETSHYDIVCNMANHWLMETAIAHAVPVGNAILTVDTKAQAMARAEGGRAGKGGDAARACLALIALGQTFMGQSPGRAS